MLICQLATQCLHYIVKLRGIGTLIFTCRISLEVQSIPHHLYNNSSLSGIYKPLSHYEFKIFAL